MLARLPIGSPDTVVGALLSAMLVVDDCSPMPHIEYVINMAD
jgi:hypothetical protein